MSASRVSVGIVGLGRWARVLAHAARKSDRLEIAAAYSRSEAGRAAFGREFGIRTVGDLAAMLADPGIAGVILTLPNEQHLPLAREVAKAGKHVYTEKPIAGTLEEGLEIEALEKTHGVTVTVGHSARLMAGIRLIRKAIDDGELGRVAFIEANFSNERALELTPQTWRWYRDRAPGGPLSQLAIHHFDVLHYLGGDIAAAHVVVAAGPWSPKLTSSIGLELPIEVTREQDVVFEATAEGAVPCAVSDQADRVYFRPAPEYGAAHVLVGRGDRRELGGGPLHHQPPVTGPPGTRQISSEWQKPGHLQEAAGRTGKAPPRAVRTWSATASRAVSSFSRAFSLSTMALVFGS